MPSVSAGARSEGLNIMSKAKAPTRAKPEIDDPLFTPREAAAYLGMTERWIKDQLTYGTIPRTKLGRLNRFRKSDLDRWIEEHTTKPGSES